MAQVKITSEDLEYFGRVEQKLYESQMEIKELKELLREFRPDLVAHTARVTDKMIKQEETEMIELTQGDRGIFDRDIMAYTYEADYHCPSCTRTRFHWTNKAYGYDMGLLDSWGIPDSATDREGNLIHPVFNTDEWQELSDWYVEENPTQRLICGDCFVTIDEYTATI